MTEALAELGLACERTGSVLDVAEIAGGFQLLARAEFAPVLARMQRIPHVATPSTATLETLAIVADRQPVGRAEMEEIYGVGVGAVLKTLPERDLVEAVGGAEALGCPLLYGTATGFLRHFGFQSLAALSPPEELAVLPSLEPEADPQP